MKCNARRILFDRSIAFQKSKNSIFKIFKCGIYDGTELQQYSGKYEIAASESGLKKINSDNNDNSAYFVVEMAEHPANYEGRRIRVVGYICKVYKRIFYLCSDNKASTEYQYRMQVIAERLAELGLKKDGRVRVEGVLIYSPVDMRYELELISLSCL